MIGIFRQPYLSDILQNKRVSDKIVKFVQKPDGSVTSMVRRNYEDQVGYTD